MYVFVFLVVLNAVVLGYYFFLRRGKTKETSVRPGSCFVLEEKYCKKGTKVFYNNRLAGVGFNLPRGTPIFVPFDGLMQSITFGVEKDGKPTSYPGIGVGISKDNFEGWKQWQNFSAVFFREPVDTIIKNIKKGEIVGKVLDKKIDYFGDYNLVVKFSVTNKDGLFAFDNDTVQRIFLK